MTFDLQKILESKRAYRRGLAGLPIAEKLRMLDALRQRALAIQGRTGLNPSTTKRQADNAIKAGMTRDRQ